MPKHDYQTKMRKEPIRISEEKAKKYFFIPLLIGIIGISVLMAIKINYFMGIIFGLGGVFFFFAISAANDF